MCFQGDLCPETRLECSSCSGSASSTSLRKDSCEHLQGRRQRGPLLKHHRSILKSTKTLLRRLDQFPGISGLKLAFNLRHTEAKEVNRKGTVSHGQFQSGNGLCQITHSNSHSGDCAKAGARRSGDRPLQEIQKGKGSDDPQARKSKGAQTDRTEARPAKIQPGHQNRSHRRKPRKMTRATVERTGERIPQRVEDTPVLDQPSQNLNHEA